MSYNDEYFFIRKPDDERYPSLTPNEDTVARDFNFRAQSFGDPPFVFHNGWRDENKIQGVSEIIADILFVGSDMVVRTPIRDRLLDKSIPHLHMHPSIYIDDRGNWHEDYWYLAFTDRFDCWDREKSDYPRDISPVRLGGMELYGIYSFSLNEKIIEKTELNKRLLFKMGGTLNAFSTCHKSLISIFRGDGKSGAELIKIADY
jgi:hypothetical protein